MNRLVRTTLAMSACVLLGASLAQAQATRTWVSGVGDDANPCSRTAPCKTFAGAISKTAAGGEISVLDPGGFGAVTITKSITINGDGTLAGILSAGTNGIIVNALSTDVIILRNLSINGAGTGLNGIRILSAKQVIIENTTILGFTQSGIDVASTNPIQLDASHVSIADGGTTGLRIAGTAPRVDASFSHGFVAGVTNGLDAGTNANLVVTDSVITKCIGVAVWGNGGSVNLENSEVTASAVGVQAQGATGTVRMTNNGIYDNVIGFGCGGGTLASAGNNRKGNNPGGPACTPTVTVTLQ